jgi:hypothetical protein
LSPTPARLLLASKSPLVSPALWDCSTRADRSGHREDVSGATQPRDGRGGFAANLKNDLVALMQA